MSNDERSDCGERSLPPVDAVGSGTVVQDAPGGGAHRGRVRLALDLIRANPTGRVMLKITVAILGAVVVTLGLALIPLPGPGWLIVIGGLAIWAVEFHWARRLLQFTRRNVRAWTKWVGGRSISVRLLLGAIGLLFVAVIVWASLKYSFGIDLIERVARYLATH